MELCVKLQFCDLNQAFKCKDNYIYVSNEIGWKESRFNQPIQFDKDFIFP